MFAQICYMLVSAVSEAAAIVIGYCIGTREYDLADRQNWKILKVFAPISTGLAILLAVFAEPLFGLFSSDPMVIAVGQQVMWVDVLVELGRCYNIVLVRDLQAVGDVMFPVTIGIASQWVIGVGVAYLLGIWLDLGLVGIWLAFMLDECLRAVLFSLRWKKGRWRTIKTV